MYVIAKSFFLELSEYVQEGSAHSTKKLMDGRDGQGHPSTITLCGVTAHVPRPRVVGAIDGRTSFPGRCRNNVAPITLLQRGLIRTRRKDQEQDRPGVRMTESVVEARSRPLLSDARRCRCTPTVKRHRVVAPAWPGTPSPTRRPVRGEH